jgi:hypothetical protein
MDKPLLVPIKPRRCNQSLQNKFLSAHRVLFHSGIALAHLTSSMQLRGARRAAAHAITRAALQQQQSGARASRQPQWGPHPGRGRLVRNVPRILSSFGGELLTINPPRTFSEVRNRGQRSEINVRMDDPFSGRRFMFCFCMFRSKL